MLDSRYGGGIGAILLICLTLLAVGAAGGVTATEHTVESADIIVEPGDSIQDAVDAAAPGETVLIREGEYEERVTIDTSITLVGEDGAILDGNELADDGPAVSIDAEEVTIEQLEVRRFDGTGIDIAGDFDLDATLSNVTVRLNQDTGVAVAAPDNTASVTITDSRITNNDGSGLFGSGSFDSLTVTNTTVEDNSDNGIDFDVETAHIESTKVANNADGDGISLTNTQDAVIRDVEVTANADHNLRIDGDPITRTVTLEEVSATLADGDDGIIVTNAIEDDTITVTNVSVRDNSDRGLSLGAETINITGVTATGNGREGIELSGTTHTIQDVTIQNNGAGGFSEQSGLVSSGAAVVTIEDAEITDNEADNIRIDGTPSERTVELTDVRADRAAGDTGITITDATEDSTITATNVQANENDDEGLDLDAETITLVDITVNDNGFEGVQLAGTTHTIRNATVQANGGGSFGDPPGILSTGAEAVTIENVVTTDNVGDNIRIEGTPSERTVELTDARADRSTAESGITITDATETSSIQLTDVQASENNDQGLSLDAETITVLNATANDNGYQGIELSGTAHDLENIVVQNNGERSFSGLPGLVSTGAENVTIQNADVSSNENDNIRIDGDATDRLVTLTEVTASGNAAGDGVTVTGALEETTIDFDLVYATGNDQDGLSLDGDIITVTNSTVGQNGGAGLQFDAIDESATVRNSSIVDSTPLIVNDDEDTEVDARQNWWGSITGPDEEAVVGAVNVSDPLTSPPGTDGAPDDPVTEYANDDGVIDAGGLQDAFGDWQAGAIDAGVLQDAFGAWQSGVPVVE